MRNSLQLFNTWEPFRNFDLLLNDFPKRETQSFVPAVDAEETETHYLFTVDMPGMKKEDINVEVKDDELHISGERKFEETKGKHWAERGFGRFERVFTLGGKADANKVEANYKDGVLSISIAKSEELKPKRVQIQ